MINHFWSTCKKQTRSVWKTCWNIKKWWLCNSELLDYLYDQNCCKLIEANKSRQDLSRQTNKCIPQQINFKGKLEETDGATMFFIAVK